MTQEEFKNKLKTFNGTSEEFIDSVFNEFVPNSGKASTTAGEVIRAMSKIIYRFYNDGDLYYKGYGLETAAPSMTYLLNFVNQYGKEEKNIFINLVKDQLYEDDDKSYKKYINSIFDQVLKVLSNPENTNIFADENNKNCLDSDASWIIENQPLYDYEFRIDDEDIKKAIKENYIDTDYVADYMLQVIQDVFGSDNLHDIEVQGYYSSNEDYLSLSIYNLTKDQYDVVKRWDSRDNFWDDFKEQEAEIFDSLSEENLEEDLDKKSYDDYYNKCKKIKEDYYKFASKPIDLKEEFDENNLDENALKTCSFKYNMGKKQIIEMIKDAKE